jgi:hypothetical protein
MPEMSPYFEAVTAQRALLLSEEESLEGTTTISLETQTDLSEDDILTYVEENFTEFLRIIRYLSKEDQELLLSYYLLSKTQNTLAIIHRTTQTLCSFLIRKAVERVGTFILLGPPTQETMRAIFLREELEYSLPNMEMSKAVELYEKTKSFQIVADIFHLHRPDVRRAIRKAAQVLEQSKDRQGKALGAYLQGLIEKASASGMGFSKRKLSKQGHIQLRDPDILGEFCIPVDHEDFERSVFTSRANR